MLVNNHFKQSIPFLDLLRAGLLRETPNPALFVNIKNHEWRDIFNMAQKQSVLGLIYSGISRLPKDLMPERDMLLQLYGITEQIRKRNILIDSVTREICGWFEQAGLEPIILKGRSVGALYAEPDLRQSGDIDLFFHRDYQLVLPVLQQKGVEITIDPHHDTFVYRGILIELHREPCDLIYDSSVCYDPIIQETRSGQMRILNRTGNAFLILMHAAIHFMASGLGLRQFCDWAVLLKRQINEEVFDEVMRLMRQQGAGQFAIEFTALAVDVFDIKGNFGWEKYASESKQSLQDSLLQELFFQGNFGDHNIPKKGEMIKWSRYAFRKFLMTFRVYPFYSDYVFFRARKRICSLFSRLFGMKKY